jgi:hypothetical protein
MTDVASLAFSIDTNQLAQANQQLSQFDQTNQRVRASTQFLVTALESSNSAITQLAASSRASLASFEAISANLDTMTMKLEALRRAVAGVTEGFKGMMVGNTFMQTQQGFQGMAALFGTTSTQLEAFNRRAQYAGLAPYQSTAALQRFGLMEQATSASSIFLRQQAAANGITMGAGTSPTQSLNQLLRMLPMLRNDQASYQFAQQYLGPLDPMSYERLRNEPYFTRQQQMTMRYQQHYGERASNLSAILSARMFRNERDMAHYQDLNKYYSPFDTIAGMAGQYIFGNSARVTPTNGLHSTGSPMAAGRGFASVSAEERNFATPTQHSILVADAAIARRKVALLVQSRGKDAPETQFAAMDAASIQNLLHHGGRSLTTMMEASIATQDVRAQVKAGHYGYNSMQARTARYAVQRDARMLQDYQTYGPNSDAGSLAAYRYYHDHQSSGMALRHTTAAGLLYYAANHTQPGKWFEHYLGSQPQAIKNALINQQEVTQKFHQGFLQHYANYAFSAMSDLVGGTKKGGNFLPQTSEGYVADYHHLQNYFGYYNPPSLTGAKLKAAAQAYKRGQFRTWEGTFLRDRAMVNGLAQVTPMTDFSTHVEAQNTRYGVLNDPGTLTDLSQIYGGGRRGELYASEVVSQQTAALRHIQKMTRSATGFSTYAPMMGETYAFTQPLDQIGKAQAVVAFAQTHHLNTDLFSSGAANGGALTLSDIINGRGASRSAAGAVFAGPQKTEFSNIYGVMGQNAYEKMLLPLREQMQSNLAASAAGYQGMGAVQGAQTYESTYMRARIGNVSAAQAHTLALKAENLAFMQQNTLMKENLSLTIAQTKAQGDLTAAEMALGGPSVGTNALAPAAVAGQLQSKFESAAAMDPKLRSDARARHAFYRHQSAAIRTAGVQSALSQAAAAAQSAKDEQSLASASGVAGVSGVELSSLISAIHGYSMQMAEQQGNAKGEGQVIADMASSIQSAVTTALAQATAQNRQSGLSDTISGNLQDAVARLPASERSRAQALLPTIQRNIASGTLGSVQAGMLTGVRGARMAPYHAAIMKYAHQYGMPPAMLERILYTESSGNASAINPSGAMGLAQGMPSTAHSMGFTTADLLDPTKSVHFAAKYLHHLSSATPNFSWSNPADVYGVLHSGYGTLAEPNARSIGLLFSGGGTPSVSKDTALLHQAINGKLSGNGVGAAVSGAMTAYGGRQAGQRASLQTSVELQRRIMQLSMQARLRGQTGAASLITASVPNPLDLTPQASAAAQTEQRRIAMQEQYFGSIGSTNASLQESQMMTGAYGGGMGHLADATAKIKAYEQSLSLATTGAQQAARANQLLTASFAQVATGAAAGAYQSRLQTIDLRRIGAASAVSPGAARLASQTNPILDKISEMTHRASDTSLSPQARQAAQDALPQLHQQLAAVTGANQQEIFNQVTAQAQQQRAQAAGAKSDMYGIAGTQMMSAVIGARSRTMVGLQQSGLVPQGTTYAQIESGHASGLSAQADAYAKMAISASEVAAKQQTMLEQQVQMRQAISQIGPEFNQMATSMVMNIGTLNARALYLRHLFSGFLGQAGSSLLNGALTSVEHKAGNAISNYFDPTSSSSSIGSSGSSSGGSTGGGGANPLLAFGASLLGGGSTHSLLGSLGGGILQTLSGNFGSTMLGSALGMGGSFLSSLFGSAATAAPIAGIGMSTDIAQTLGAFSANGNVFSEGQVIPFANGGVVTRPTRTPMALMGEAGAEAVIPLRRGPDGKLGISMANSGGPGMHGGGIVVNAPITVNGAQMGQNGMDQNSLKKMHQQLASTLHSAMMDTLANQARPGGTIYGSTHGMFAAGGG